MKLRRLIYRQLHQRSWEHEGLSPLNRLIFVVICLSVFLVIVETEKPFYLEHRHIFRILDCVVGAFFAVEYVLRVWSAGQRTTYKGIVGKLKYMITPYALIDLLVIVPFFVTSSSNIFVARFIRLFRILAIAKVARYSQAFDLVREAVVSRRHELIFSLILTCIVLLSASTVMWVVEPDEKFRSIPRALWWGIITLTTVGYGDVYPTTVLGKVISGITALAGIGLIAMPAGILAAAFGDAINRHKHELEQRKSGSYSRVERAKVVREERSRGFDSHVEDTHREIDLSGALGANSSVVCDRCGHDKFVFKHRNTKHSGEHSEDGEADFSPNELSITGAQSRSGIAMFDSKSGKNH
ncbi:MAG: ion transporter [Candidatus Obscuribacterales bacterium]|nr:ion transporter [Candidatus Obscuribacterales bacterium]